MAGVDGIKAFRLCYREIDYTITAPMGNRTNSRAVLVVIGANRRITTNQGHIQRQEHRHR